MSTKFFARLFFLLCQAILPVALHGQVIYQPYSFSTFAGKAGVASSADGIGSAARFTSPSEVAFDSANNLYVADTGNHTIRKITSAGVVSTFAGSPGVPGSADGTGSAARFSSPIGVSLDSAGNLYVGDADNDTIRKITPAGTVTTLAGKPGVVGSADGTGSNARFSSPRGVVVDAAGDVYVADTFNNTIRKVTPAGVVSTLAGLAGATGSADGTGSVARFNHPRGVAVDTASNIFVADTDNNTIRRITPAGAVTTVAGSAGMGGSADGSVFTARFLAPIGITVSSSGDIYLADALNDTIRKISALGVVSTAGVLVSPATPTALDRMHGSLHRKGSLWIAVITCSLGIPVTTRSEGVSPLHRLRRPRRYRPHQLLRRVPTGPSLSTFRLVYVLKPAKT